jgi:hypothetical protein
MEINACIIQVEFEFDSNISKQGHAWIVKRGLIWYGEDVIKKLGLIRGGLVVTENELKWERLK